MLEREGLGIFYAVILINIREGVCACAFCKYTVYWKKKSLIQYTVRIHEMDPWRVLSIEKSAVLSEVSRSIC